MNGMVGIHCRIVNIEVAQLFKPEIVYTAALGYNT
jgi:hypothetical protein